MTNKKVIFVIIDEIQCVRFDLVAPIYLKVVAPLWDCSFPMWTNEAGSNMVSRQLLKPVITDVIYKGMHFVIMDSPTADTANNFAKVCFVDSSLITFSCRNAQSCGCRTLFEFVKTSIQFSLSKLSGFLFMLVLFFMYYFKFMYNHFCVWLKNYLYVALGIRRWLTSARWYFG